MNCLKNSLKTPAWLIGMLLVHAACGQMTFDEKLDKLYNRTVPLIRPTEAKAELPEAGTYLLDIRSEEEFGVSHLPGARLVAYDTFDPAQVSDIPRDARVIVYCSVGYRSEKAGEKLLEAGFTNVANLYGGIFQWKNQGLDVVNMNHEPTDSVHTYNKKWSQWLTNGIKVYD